MTLQTILNCLLILLGAIIIMISIGTSGNLFKSLIFVPDPQRQQIRRYLVLLRLLMAFFSFGYIVVMVDFAIQLSSISRNVVSLVFFFGAIFVLMGVHVQSRLLSEVQNTLHGILPICCKCKKIRLTDQDPYDPGAWKGIEEYVSQNSKVDFSHGYCPDCFREEIKKMHDVDQVSDRGK